MSKKPKTTDEPEKPKAAARPHETVLGLCIETRVPVLLWGVPGIGKTAVIRQMAEHRGMVLEVLPAATVAPEEVGGVYLSSGERRLPDWAQRLLDAGPLALLFVDEITGAPASVQSAFLTMIQDKQIAGKKIPQLVVVAAANEADIAAAGIDLPAPSANRFHHLPWPVPTAEAVAEGLMLGWKPVAQLPGLVEGGEAHAEMEASIVTGFLRRNSTVVHDMPKDEVSRGKAWPSPRTWEMAVILVREWARRGRPGGDPVYRAIFSGCVGEGASSSLSTYRANLDLPHPEDVVARPFEWPLPPRSRSDITHTILLGVAAYVADKPELWADAIRCCAHAARGKQADIGGAAARVLLEHQPPGVEIPEEFGEFYDLVSRAGLLKGRSR